MYYCYTFPRPTTTIGKERIIGCGFTGRNVRFWKEYFNQYEDCDYYNLFEDVQFSWENMGKVYEEYERENNILLGLQTEQLREIERREKLISEL